MNKKIINSFLIVWYLLSANTTFAYTHADTLRGSNGRGREWWDVQHYGLKLKFDTTKKEISGTCAIVFKITQIPADSMQIDLQDALIIESVMTDNDALSAPGFKKDGNVWWIKGPFHNWQTGSIHSVIIQYKGSPQIAQNPPWDGGFTWTHDSAGNQWIAVSCQGKGASVWWPCKDAQWDEPDNGMDIWLKIPRNYSAVSNGQLVNTDYTIDIATSHWMIKNPINNYDVTFYIGDYVHWHDTLNGEKGVLDLDFWVLRENEKKARKQFAVVKEMLHCLEYWMGPYPFYEDGYKLVDAPYLGMEHQGAVAYGNQYKMGYLGRDRSLTGYGMKFDYIIVHESGHEWFGNNITARDIADNWIHEGFTTYTESLFAECIMGKEKAGRYSKGERHSILNDKPIIGDYGVNEEGSGDMYDKGETILYMIRTLTNDDEKFRQMLRGLNKEFYHQVVTTRQVEDYVAVHTGLDLTAFFDQYLRTSNIPEIEYFIKGKMINYRFTNIVNEFTLPVTISAGNKSATIQPTASWQKVKWKGGYNVHFSDDFLFTVKK